MPPDVVQLPDGAEQGDLSSTGKHRRRRGPRILLGGARRPLRCEAHGRQRRRHVDANTPQARVSFDAIPSQEIHVQLVGDTLTSDQTFSARLAAWWRQFVVLKSVPGPTPSRAHPHQWVIDLSPAAGA